MYQITGTEGYARVSFGYPNTQLHGIRGHPKQIYVPQPT